MLLIVATITDDSLCAGTSTATRGRGPRTGRFERTGRQASSTWTNSTSTGSTMSSNTALNNQPSSVIMPAP
ncbi:hypothetical protein D3C73_717970 [compost metagenome]